MGTPIMDTVQNIILDVSKEENQVRVSIKKRDANKWLWRFCLVDDGQPVDLSWAKSACFRAKKPDNTKIWNPCVIRGNVVEYTVTDETVSAAGTLVGEVELTGGHYDSNGNIVGEKLTSACFAIKVLEHTVSDDELTSESEFGVLDKMQMEIAALDDKFPVQTEDIADGAVTPEKTDFAKMTSKQVTGSGFTWIKTGTSAPDKPGWMTYTIESGDENQYFADAENDGFYVSVAGGYINTSGKWVVIPEDVGSSHFERPLHEIVVTRYPAVVTFVSAESGYWGYFAPGTELEYIQQELTIPNLSVDGEQIEDGTVTPEKTSFVEIDGYIIGGTGGGDLSVSTGGSAKVSVQAGFPYMLYDTTGAMKPPDTMQVRYYDEDGSLLSYQLITNLPAVYPDDMTFNKGWLVVPPRRASKLNVMLDGLDTKETYYYLYPLKPKNLSIPGLKLEDETVQTSTLADGAVTTAKLADGAVTEDKLADGVKEKLQDGLKRIKVDELPSDEGQVLYRFEGEWDVVNNPSSSTPNLLVKDWGTPLVTPIDLTPITSSKQLRMTVIADATDGNEPSFSNGGVELRNWSSGVETKVSHNMPLSAGPEGNEIAYPLTSFTPQDSDAWSKINGFRVWTYGENTSGSYIMKIRDVRIVDTSVGIDPNAIYIVPSDDPQAGDAHDEYMYIDGAWEKIGGSLADGEVTTQKLANGAVTEDKLSDGAVTVEKTDFAGRKWVFKSVEGELWANYTQESGSTSTGTISTPGGGNYLLYPNTVPQDPSRAFITLHGSSMKAVALSDLAEVSCSDTSYSHGLLLQVPPEYYEFELSIQPEHTSAAGEDTAYYTACSVEEERLLVDGLLVMEENLRDGAVTTTKLADGAVTAEKLADGVLDSAGVVQTGTATLTCTGGAASEKFDCSYTKIGNMVTLRGSGYNITTTWGTGVTFTGLPFPCQGVSGFVWKSTSSAGFWGFGYLSGSSLNICKEIAYSPYEGSKTDLTGPYDGTGFTVTYITGS